MLRRPTLAALLVAPLVALALAACGSSSGSATTLLKETFSGSHTVNSGNLDVNLTVIPSGSSTISGPITLRFGGPFASLGTGKLPKSDFTLSISALGHTGSLGIISTGANGYVTLQGTSYQLPAATFQQLQSSFSSLTASSGGSGTLSKLGIDPLHWLVHPTIAGSDTIGGAKTTHIRAGINVPALLSDLNTFLGRASSLGVSGAADLPRGISPATRSRIASEVQQPRVDVWTGASDKTLRKLLISLRVPVTGQLSSLLGGLSSAQISLSMQYADLNRPQTITAPSSVAPFSQFQAKLRSILASIQTALGGTIQGTSPPSSGSGSSSGSSSSVSRYGQCLQAAGGDVAKMQQCASLLNGK